MHKQFRQKEHSFAYIKSADREEWPVSGGLWICAFLLNTYFIKTSC